MEPDCQNADAPCSWLFLQETRGTEVQSTFPIYILQLGAEQRVVASEGRADINHMQWWEQTVARIVAKHYHLPLAEVLELPYCQLLKLIRRALSNEELAFVHDDHECRLPEDVLRFTYLLKANAPAED